MDAVRVAVWATVVLVAGVMVISGPLVGTVDLTTEDPNRGRITCEESGSVDVEVRQLPTESFALAKQDSDTGMYALEADPLIIEAANVTGCPVVSYELRIPKLGIFAFNNYYPANQDEGPATMEFVGTTIEPDRIDRDSYDARLTINVSGDRNRTLHRENLTIPVED